MLITSDLLMLDSCKSKEKAHKQKHLRYYDNREAIVFDYINIGRKFN